MSHAIFASCFYTKKPTCQAAQACRCHRQDKKTQATCGHKNLISLFTPCSLLANPLRSYCAPCGFAREELLSRDIFLAKPQRSQRRSMNIFAAAFHHLCFFSNDFPRLFTTYARCRLLSAEVCSSCTFRSSCRAQVGWVRGPSAIAG